MLDILSHDVNPTAQLDSPIGTVGEFITEYQNNDGRKNRIIGQSPANGSVEFTEITEIWGSSLTYILNAKIIDATIGWVWTRTDIHSTKSTAIESWGSSINAIPANSPRITVCSHVVQSRVREKLLHRRHLDTLWRLFIPSTDGQIRLIVCANTRFHRRI